LNLYCGLCFPGVIENRFKWPHRHHLLQMTVGFIGGEPAAADIGSRCNGAFRVATQGAGND